MAPNEVKAVNRTANAELHLTGRIDQSIAAGTIEDFTGTEYHCHIFDHDNNGMMGVISVS
ncbi:MAG: hypothetical protein H7226_08560 [Salinibacterium sp.]|nr:hypothetical protein [Salinibacterium sp.]